MTPALTEWAHLRQAGTSVLVVLEDGQPVVRHWGDDLGVLDARDVAATSRALTRTVTHSSLDRPRVHPLLPDPASGWTGTAGIELRRTGMDAIGPAPRHWTVDPSGGSSVTLVGADPEYAVSFTCVLGLDDFGVLTLDYAVTNTGDDDLAVGSLLPSLPLPGRAQELLDLTGRWGRERSPQRMPLHKGTWRRDARHGRTGHDATLLLVAGTPGFAFRTGEVWGVHVAWSGDHVTLAERTPEGHAQLAAGELLAHGEVVLAPGDTYRAPPILAAWSDVGLDGVTARLHRHVRAMPHLRGRRRPVVLNTWEAVYFDHDLDTLVRLADRAAEVGIERFVLDDGWFRRRTDDRRALGDWVVDDSRWPDGLPPLIEHVRRRGMDFGLWVEPEMVNEDSDLAREHPDWILRGRAALPPDWRHQQVLDLHHPGAYAHVRDALLRLVDEHDIAFLKWDHNRDLIDAGHEGHSAVHDQTLAVYRLLDELRARHPQLEIETCASGGGRVDLGILARTHRLWPSDTNDAVERVGIQRWTQLLVPPELVGQHVGAHTAHTTGRTHRLGFRAAVALLGHFGVEWDLLSAAPEELDELTAWVALHKELRPTLGSGTVVRGDHPDQALVVSGVVSADRSEAWFVLAQVAASQTSSPAPVQLPGLDPAARYDVNRVGPVDAGIALGNLSGSWLDDESGLRLPGSVLDAAGLQLPVLPPESAVVLRLSLAGG